MKRTIVSSVAVLVLSAIALADESSSGQASDASTSSSTIVSGPVQASASDSGQQTGTDSGSPNMAQATLDPNPAANEVQLAPGHDTAVTPFDGVVTAPFVNTDFVVEPPLPIAPDQSAANAAHVAATAATTVPGPAPLLAMAIGLAGLAIKRKRA